MDEYEESFVEPIARAIAQEEVRAKMHAMRMRRCVEEIENGWPRQQTFTTIDGWPVTLPGQPV